MSAKIASVARCLEARLLGVAPAGADLRHEPARDVDQVLALIALVGQLDGVAEQLQVARAQRLREHAHLPAGVVEVVLAHDLVPGRVEQSRDAVAEHGVATVPDRERPGRIRGHELDHHRGALPGRALATLRPRAARA